MSNKEMKKYKSIYVQMAMSFVSGILLLSIPNPRQARTKEERNQKFIFSPKALSTLSNSE